MAAGEKFKWMFTSRFRSGAYSWKASRLAVQRIKEAVSEIKRINRKDCILSSAGAVLFIEKLVSAIGEVDSSSGALGRAVYHALEQLTDIIIKAEVDRETKQAWLERIWDAVQDDGYGYLDNLPGLWGELCGDAEIASEWADFFMDITKLSWTRGGYFAGSTACLSCLLAAGRYEELLSLLELAPYVAWHYRSFGVQALVKLGRKAEAIRYAQNSCGLNDSKWRMEEMCEEILLSSNLREEAYRRYALPRLALRPGLPAFRIVVKKYPEKDPKDILKEALDEVADQPGKWFATAKQLGMLDLASEIAQRSPVEPKTLNRAAADFLNNNLEFSLIVALASLHWLSQGWGYEVTAMDVLDAHRLSIEAGRRLGKTEEVEREIIRIIGENSLSLNYSSTGIGE